MQHFAVFVGGPYALLRSMLIYLSAQGMWRLESLDIVHSTFHFIVAHFVDCEANHVASWYLFLDIGTIFSLVKYLWQIVSISLANMYGGYTCIISGTTWGCEWNKQVRANVPCLFSLNAISISFFPCIHIYTICSYTEIGTCMFLFRMLLQKWNI